MRFSHTPVMPAECMDGLRIDPAGTYVDCTLGGGGHSAEIAKRLQNGGKLIAFDKDGEAISFASERLTAFDGRITFVNRDFKEAPEALKQLGIDKINGFLMDLGVSSYQLDNPERGFSYLSASSLLDMRMDARQELSAKEVVNGYSEQELAKLIFTYGEERFSRQIAANIVKQRQIKEILTTGELVEIIERSIPAKIRFKEGHCAKRTFQAIRIEVNGELDGLDKTITDLVEMLEPDGRAAVLTFHSLEDRIVKQTFNYLATECLCPPKTPICICGKKAMITLPFKKPLTAGEVEMQINPRSKSAKLRVAEKI